MNDLNVLVVGLGSIGRRHARLLKEMPDVRVSVVEPVQANIDRAVGEAGPVKVYPTLEDALRHPFDIVMIATPHTMHTAQTVQCLEAGCNVFCEKPMSDTLEGCGGHDELPPGGQANSWGSPICSISTRWYEK